MTAAYERLWNDLKGGKTVINHSGFWAKYNAKIDELNDRRKALKSQYNKCYLERVNKLNGKIAHAVSSRGGAKCNPAKGGASPISS